VCTGGGEGANSTVWGGGGGGAGATDDDGASAPASATPEVTWEADAAENSEVEPLLCCTHDEWREM